VNHNLRTEWREENLVLRGEQDITKQGTDGLWGCAKNLKGKWKRPRNCADEPKWMEKGSQTVNARDN